MLYYMVQMCESQTDWITLSCGTKCHESQVRDKLCKWNPFANSLRFHPVNFSRNTWSDGERGGRRRGVGRWWTGGEDI